MSIDQINAGLFSVHVALLGAYIYACIFLMRDFTITKTKNGKKLMVVFSNLSLILFIMVCLFLEIYFIYSFFAPIDLYFYEYINIIQQIIFIYLFTNLLRKEA